MCLKWDEYQPWKGQPNPHHHTQNTRIIGIMLQSHSSGPGLVFNDTTQLAVCRFARMEYGSEAKFLAIARRSGYQYSAICYWTRDSRLKNLCLSGLRKHARRGDLRRGIRENGSQRNDFDRELIR
jgi:hypothetical protein